VADTRELSVSQPLNGGEKARVPPYTIGASDEVVRLAGDLTMANAAAIWRDLDAATRRAAKSQRPVDFDLSGVRRIDAGTMAFVAHWHTALAAKGVRSEIVGAGDAAAELLALFRLEQPTPARKRRRSESTVAQVGRVTLEVLAEAKQVVAFLGSILAAFLGVAIKPRTGNWRDIAPIAERAGADAVPIVVLINFLVGFVMSFQAARQLELYGANLLVADLVGISMARELGPLMTAIIVSGRSGAAFAAELGTMKVSEEIDALRAMGFGPLRYLVLPRMIALVLVVPLLALLADVVGCLGGLAVAVTTLDVGATAYLNQLRSAVMPSDVVSGLVKSVIFGATIALIACQQGFATSGGAEGVGRRTTATVVSSLFAIVLIDAAFTMALRGLGL
jgi:phospholipid/cholesterol/gamma-HCH transport system permease protein